MEKREVTVSVGGQRCSFYSDDPDEYIAALEQRANAAMKQTEAFSGSSSHTNAVLAVLYLTDQLMRAEQDGSGKSVPKDTEKGTVKETVKNTVKSTTKNTEKDRGQVSMWELLEGRAPERS